MLKNKEVCEDIIQEVFVNIWNKRGNLDVKTSLKSYLYASVLYKVYGYFRKNSDNIHVELIEGFNTHIQYSNPETKLIQEELLDKINEIVESLPKKCRLVFKLSRDRQLSHKEIALKLNISTKTIETHITKALKTIKSSLGHSFCIEIITLLYYTILN